MLTPRPVGAALGLVAGPRRAPLNSYTTLRDTNLPGASYPTANASINDFAEKGFLVQVADMAHPRLYAFRPNLDILREAETAAGAAPATG